MRTKTLVAFVFAIVALWIAADALAQRGGRGGGARGGGGGGGARGGGLSRPAGGGYSRPSTPNINRTPSFSQPRPSTPARPSVSTRPSTPTRPSNIGASQPSIGTRPSTLPSGGVGRPAGGVGRPDLTPGTRPSIGGPGVGKPGISTLPATRPGAGGRGVGPGTRPGGAGSRRPGFGTGLAAGLASGALAGATLPGLGERGERPSSPGERREHLQGRLDQSRDFRTDRRDERRGDRQERIEDRGGNRQERIEDRQTTRQDLQQHRQDYLTQRREDWQDWHDDHHWYHDGWHHGYWHGNWGGWWDHMWSEHPLAAGLGVTWWGVNRLSSWYGFPYYYNPYYEVPATPAVYNYAEPPVIVYEQAVADIAPPADPGGTAVAAATLPPGVTMGAAEKFDQARAAFYEGNYDQALKLTDEVLATMPKDALIHEFRALVLFALKRYQEAAAVMHAVLAVGPGWDFTTLSSLYPGIASTYTPQLRALEAYRDANPTRPEAHFLLAYHYLTCGHTETAAGELREVCKLQPKDAVSAELLRTIAPGPEMPAATAVADVKPIPPEHVVGTWTASGVGQSRYSMTLAKDGTFTWTYEKGSRKQQVKGVYAVEGNSLVMEPDGGGTLLADLKFKGADDLLFQVVGAPKGEPGLGFRKG